MALIVAFMLLGIDVVVVLLLWLDHRDKLQIDAQNKRYDKALAEANAVQEDRHVR